MKRWTDAEIEIVRALYPTGGAAACMDKLPGRTKAAIEFRAWQISSPRAEEIRAKRKLKALAVDPRDLIRAPEPPAPAPAEEIVILRAEGLRPGMVANRYPVGTMAKPAFRRITDARVSASGAHRFFALSWSPEAPSPGARREVGMAHWDMSKFPELSFQVKVSA